LILVWYKKYHFCIFFITTLNESELAFDLQNYRDTLKLSSLILPIIISKVLCLKIITLNTAVYWRSFIKSSSQDIQMKLLFLKFLIKYSLNKLLFHSVQAGRNQNFQAQIELIQIIQKVWTIKSTIKTNIFSKVIVYKSWFFSATCITLSWHQILKFSATLKQWQD